MSSYYALYNGKCPRHFTEPEGACRPCQEERSQRAVGLSLNGHTIGTHNGEMRSVRWRCQWCDEVAEVLDEFLTFDCGTQALRESNSRATV